MPFTIERNDLSAIEVDAIVVAANERLQITGGVGLTVALAAGFDELQAACDEIGFCPCGSAVATPAFELSAKVVIHAVGPVWHGGERGEADFLRSAYDAALECAYAEGAHSVALPLISAGTYGFPADVSLAVARESIRAFLNRHDDVDVRLVLYSRESVTAGMAAYLDIAEYIDNCYVESYSEWRSIVLEAPSVHAPRPMATNAPEPQAHRAKRRCSLFQQIGEAIGDARDRRKETAGESTDDGAATMPAMAAAAPAPAGAANLEDLLDSLDAPFSTTLLALIDERGMTDAQVYKRANMSRQLFSKIRSDADYRPTKKTALALAVALGLDLDETDDLLARAGFALSTSSKADVIVEYFIRTGNHDIFEINEALYAFDQPLL
ncbi:MAG: macro domain-containing protein [Eggerthellaceae bacterium]|nr:macro domain-containing protein [Eggerthellaceae bacterium]